MPTRKQSASQAAPPIEPVARKAPAPHGPLLLFFFLVAIIYGALLIPWPGVLTTYRAGAAAAGNLFFSRIAKATLRFEPLPTPALDKDIELTMINPGRGTATMYLNARRMYLPTAFVASLILAAPIPARRKLIALAVGLALISAYHGFATWIQLTYTLSDPRGLAAVTLEDSTRRFLLVLMRILTMSPVTPYIVSLLVFVLAAIRREDLVRLSGRADDPLRRPARQKTA